jgi:hypothetical protein
MSALILLLFLTLIVAVAVAFGECEEGLDHLTRAAHAQEVQVILRSERWLTPEDRARTGEEPVGGLGGR